MTQCTGRRRAMVQQKGEFAYRYTELSTLVMKLHYRLLDALEDEALAYIETQQVARNGCEVLRLLKSRYALETQYIETDLITKVHTWTFDKNDLERSIIEWERLILCTNTHTHTHLSLCVDSTPINTAHTAQYSLFTSAERIARAWLKNCITSL